jgi:hypothetical protein
VNRRTKSQTGGGPGDVDSPRLTSAGRTAIFCFPRPNVLQAGELSIETKKCSRCAEVKDADQFYRRRDVKDGLTSACRPCIKVRAVDWAKAHPENRQQINHRYAVKRWAQRD